MKLIHKTIIYYLLISIPLLLLAGVFSYNRIKTQLNEEIEESLAKEALHAESIAASFNQPHDMYLDFGNLSSIKISTAHQNFHSYTDTSVYSNFEQEVVPCKMIRSYVNCNGQTYLITIIKSTLEDDDLMESLFSSFLVIIAFLILAFFIVNWWISKKLWQPFYSTLSKLETYDIKQHHTYQFDKSSISEFSQLNSTLTKMTDKLYSDFLQQKEFTENASHEMQTPLAVVKANLSLLMQSPNLKEDEMNQLQSIENTVKKLTALNKALILLSKIENHQFNESVAVNFNDKIKSIIKHNQELVDNKNIALETKFDNELIIPFNTTLADVLMTNLLQNAIRHNITDGSIYVEVKDMSITISNTGEPLSVPEDELFVRFKKNDASKDSLGLGLSIVKSIASLYNVNVSYHHSSNKHTFTLNF